MHSNRLTQVIVVTFAFHLFHSMSASENTTAILSNLSESFNTSTFLKLTLSNKRSKSDDLNNVFIKPVVIKEQAVLNLNNS